MLLGRMDARRAGPRYHSRRFELGDEAVDEWLGSMSPGPGQDSALEGYRGRHDLITCRLACWLGGDQVDDGPWTGPVRERVRRFAWDSSGHALTRQRVAIATDDRACVAASFDVTQEGADALRRLFAPAASDGSSSPFRAAGPGES